MTMGLLALASVSDGLVDNSKQTLMIPLSEYSEMAKKTGEVVHPSHCRTHREIDHTVCQWITISLVSYGQIVQEKVTTHASITEDRERKSRNVGSEVPLSLVPNSPDDVPLIY